jgi:hypothetical protein
VLLKTEKELLRKVGQYKHQLVMAIEEKASYDNKLCPDIDLVIFSLIDKLETLFWVLEMELPEGDLLDGLSRANH